MQDLSRHVAVLSLLAAPALAQGGAPVPVVQEGDLVPGVGNVTTIEELSVNDRGEWVVSAHTNAANPDVDVVVLDAGGLRLQEGQPMAGPTNALLRHVYGLHLGRNGMLSLVCSLTGPGQTPSGQVYLDSDPLLLVGDLLTHPSAAPGTSLRQVFHARSGHQGQVVSLAWLDDPSLPSSLEYAILETDASGVTRVRVEQGDVLPGQTQPIAFFPPDPDQLAHDGGQRTVFVAEVVSGSTQNTVIYLLDGNNLTELAQEGDPSPIPGRNWSNLSNSCVGVNELGQVALSGYLSGPGSPGLLVLDGQKVVQSGDSLPAIAPFQLIGVGGAGGAPIDLARTGDILWRGQWNDPDTTRDAGLFLGARLIVQEGVTTVGGVVVELVKLNYCLSGNGRWVLFEADLADGTSGAFLVDTGLGAPVTTCTPAVPNSTGSIGHLSLTGFDVPGGEPLRLFAWDLPANQFGYFLLSRTLGNVPFPNGSQGTLCLGGDIGRFQALAASSGSAGYLEIGVDTNALPVNPVAPVLSGETWTFQCWHRDLAPTPTSNFTEAVSVTFQ